VTERSGRFGKFGFLADPAKFPRSHGSRASTIGCPKHCHPADTQRHGHFDRLSAHGLGMPASEKLHMNRQRHCLEFTADRIMVRCLIGSRYR
jgi:hypothetical protein